MWHRERNRSAGRNLRNIMSFYFGTVKSSVVYKNNLKPTNPTIFIRDYWHYDLMTSDS